MIVFRIFAILIAFVTPLAAQDGPAFDCARASSSVEEAICADPDLAAADRKLADIYAAALTAAEGIDEDSDDAVAKLKATQRGWIKGRDECWKAEVSSNCIADAYARRIGELVAFWMLEEPQRVDRYTCNGNPADEVWVMVFTPQSIRVEWGDRVEPMTLSPSGSGALYDGAFGLRFWMKGEEALFTRQDGDEVNCRLEAE